MVFYVGQVEDEEEIPDPDSGIGSVTGQAWANVTRSALMPGCVTPTTSSAPPPSSSAGKKITSQPYSIHTSRGSIRELTPHYVNAECKMSRKVHEGYIVEVFEIRKQPSDSSYGWILNLTFHDFLETGEKVPFCGGSRKGASRVANSLGFPQKKKNAKKQTKSIYTSPVQGLIYWLFVCLVL